MLYYYYYKPMVSLSACHQGILPWMTILLNLHYRMCLMTALVMSCRYAFPVVGLQSHRLFSRLLFPVFHVALLPDILFFGLILFLLCFYILLANISSPIMWMCLANRCLFQIKSFLVASSFPSDSSRCSSL